MSELVSVGRGHTLAPEAAASWKRMVAAGMPDGGLTSSTRSLARQWELYNHKGEPGWPKYVAHPNESKHVWRPDDKKDKGGRAVDVNDPTRSWLVTHGGAHGWYRPWPSVEPWHFEYQGHRDQHKNRPLKEDPMELSDETIDKIAERVMDRRNELSPVAAEIAGQPTMRTRGMLQQLLYIRRDVGEILRLLKARK